MQPEMCKILMRTPTDQKFGLLDSMAKLSFSRVDMWLNHIQTVNKTDLFLSVFVMSFSESSDLDALRTTTMSSM